MRRLDFTNRSRADIKGALRHSREAFGAVVHRRYSRLIDQALSDILDEPGRAGVRTEAPGLFTYHLRSSTRRLPAPERITRPRHILVFRLDPDRLLIVRVLDDRMNLLEQLARER